MKKAELELSFQRVCWIDNRFPGADWTGLTWEDLYTALCWMYYWWNPDA